MLDAEFWDGRYTAGTDGWTLERAPEILARLIGGMPAGQRVLVPGAGLGHDAFAWARAGHEVVALDFAPGAVKSMRERAAEEGLAVEVIEADVTAPPTRLHGSIDIVWEQTCLCALDPELRRPYVEAMAKVLGASGRMIALLWNHGREGGPPHDMTPELVEALVEGVFEVRASERVEDSLSTRTQQFLWWLDPLA